MSFSVIVILGVFSGYDINVDNVVIILDFRILLYIEMIYEV